MARGRPRKIREEETLPQEVMMMEVSEQREEKANAELPIDEMRLETLADYKLYNKRAREYNKRARKVVYPVKQAPLDLHPKQRVVFQRKDQPRNPLPVYLSTDLIEYRATLIPGKTYDLPVAVLKYLGERGTPVFEWFEQADGSKETRETHKEPRFAFRTLYEEE